ncbi:tetraspanin-1 [Prorops nasuta]|uniref:tetraspanin-1 n=1 Tax=Prorops nasuta TaxID=863751 RepID=UPI0034CD5996
MVLNECYGFTKYGLICINLIFWAVGLASVVLAIWMLTDQTFMVSIAQDQQNFNSGLCILLVAGVLMLLVAFLGCCGAFRESQCMLIGFFSCLLVVIVAQVAAAAWLYANSDQLEKLITASITNTVKNEYGEIESRTQTVDAFQSGLHCCGATSPNDWAGSKYASHGSSQLGLTVTADASNVFSVPESCCKDSSTCQFNRTFKLGDTISPAIYNEGCTYKLIEALKSLSNVVLGVVVGVGILELLGLIFSLVLYCAIGSSDRYKS